MIRNSYIDLVNLYVMIRKEVDCGERLGLWIYGVGFGTRPRLSADHHMAILRNNREYLPGDMKW